MDCFVAALLAMTGDQKQSSSLLSSGRLARQSLGFQPLAIPVKGLLGELMLPHGLLCIAPSLGLLGLALLRR